MTMEDLQGTPSDPVSDSTSGPIRRASLPPDRAAELLADRQPLILDHLGRLSAATRRVNELSNRLLAPALDAFKDDPVAAQRVVELAEARTNARSLSDPAASSRTGNGTGNGPWMMSPLAVVTPGLDVIAPPWDVHPSWPNDDSQFVNANTDTNSTAIVYCRSRNDAASGDGWAGYVVSLTSPTTRAVSIRPYLPCEVSYDFWSHWLNATSRGGFGVQVTDTTGASVFGPIYPEVWNHTALNDDDTHFSQTDYLQAHLPNGEIAFTMEANETHHLWLTIWAHGDSSGLVFTDLLGNDYGSRCSFEFTMSLPFIVIL